MEVVGMARTIADDLMEQGEARSLRRMLRRFLEQKFGQLPESVLQRIEVCKEIQTLETAILNVSRLEKLDDLRL
jgi:hypothetical protein